jgi:hypothetical protein
VGTGGGMTSQRAGTRPSRRARVVWWGEWQALRCLPVTAHYATHSHLHAQTCRFQVVVLVTAEAL